MKKPKNDMFVVTIEGYHRNKPVFARYERYGDGWQLWLTIDGAQRSPIVCPKGDKP